MTVDVGLMIGWQRRSETFDVRANFDYKLLEIMLEALFLLRRHGLVALNMVGDFWEGLSLKLIKALLSEFE